jgi:glutamate 5-kinase
MMKPRVLLKFGTGILTKPNTVELDGTQFVKLTSAVASLQQAGYACIIVTSGAVAAGLPSFGLQSRPSEDTSLLQACAAVGQCHLMHTYETLFQFHGLQVAQLLVTYLDFDVKERAAYVRATLDRLLQAENIIPIINENDSVATEELRFGDNDVLSAHLAVLAGVNQLVLFTSVDGLLKPGSEQIITEVTDVAEVMSFVREEKGSLSVGGMDSKLRSVQKAVNAGIETFIANGRRPEQLLDLIEGRGVGTRFLTSSR